MPRREVCDLKQNVTDEEWADRILSPEQDKKKDLFFDMLNEQKYDMILSFAAGGNDIVYPKILREKEYIFKTMASTIDEHKSIIENDLECPESLQRQTTQNTLQRLTNMIYIEHKVPMFTLKLHCCKIPSDQEIAMVWRHNIHKMLNFLKLTDTGVQGYVKSTDGKPLRNATVKVLNSDRIVHSVTKNSAHFKIILPAGDYTIIVNSIGCTTYQMVIAVTFNNLYDMGEIVLTPGLESDQYDYGATKTDQISGNIGLGSVTSGSSQLSGNY